MTEPKKRGRPRRNDYERRTPSPYHRPKPEQAKPKQTEAERRASRFYRGNFDL